LNALERRSQGFAITAIELNVVARRVSNVQPNRLANDPRDGLGIELWQALHGHQDPESTRRRRARQESRRPEVRPLVDLSDCRPAEPSDFQPAIGSPHWTISATG